MHRICLDPTLGEYQSKIADPRKDSSTQWKHDHAMMLFAGLLYNLTDEAMRACPPSTQWVLATNGDNLYAKDLFRTVIDAPADADVIALDYYSRYQRTTGPPCARFAASRGLPPCKQNRYHCRA